MDSLNSCELQSFFTKLIIIMGRGNQKKTIHYFRVSNSDLLEIL